MIGLDTNVLIRYITQDDKDQAEIAGDIIEQNCTIYEPGYINQIVICEIVWVLRRAYGYEKKIVIRVIQKILQTSEMVVENSENVLKALDAYKNGKADYSDYLIAFSNGTAGCKYTITFDKRAANFKLFKGLSSL